MRKNRSPALQVENYANPHEFFDIILICLIYDFDMCYHISNIQQAYLLHTLKHIYNIPQVGMFLLFFSPKFQTRYYILNIPNT